MWTQRDKTLSQVLQYVQKGWPTEGDTELEPYSSRRNELSSYEGCILWGNQVVVPPPGREAIIQQLHGGHTGITRMKALAQMYVWWPGISADIEKSVRLCRECQQVQSAPPLAPLHPWSWPTRVSVPSGHSAFSSSSYPKADSNLSFQPYTRTDIQKLVAISAFSSTRGLTSRSW